MQVELVASEPCGGVVRGDLSARRGEIGTVMDRDAGPVAIAATVPLANLVGYPATLSAPTQGGGAVTMRFSHFGQADPFEPPRFLVAAALRA